MFPPVQKIYPILDLEICRRNALNPLEILRIWEDLGLRWFQLRIKNTTTAEYLEFARLIRGRFPDLKMIANDYLNCALDGRDLFSGIHLGQEDFEALSKQELFRFLERMGAGRRDRTVSEGEFLCGISTHNLEQFCRSLQVGKDRDGSGIGGDQGIFSDSGPFWDYLAVGPMCETHSKPGGQDPVLSEEVREGMFRWIGEHLFRKENGERGGRTEPSIVLIGGLNAESWSRIISRNFFKEYGFQPVPAVIGAALHGESLRKFIALLDEYIA